MFPDHRSAPVSGPIASSLWSRRRLFASSLSTCLNSLGALAVRSVDGLLRLCFGIGEFSRRADCVLRISTRKCSSKVLLPQAVVVEKNAPILELHFWNEHLGRCHNHDGFLGWALCVEKRVRLSLMLLADHIGSEDAKKYDAIYASLLISSQRSERVLRGLGFAILLPDHSRLQSLRDALDSSLLVLLRWAYHPHKPKRKRRKLMRIHLWMSRAQFERMYGRPTYALDS